MPPRKLGALLAYLATPPGRVCSREELMARFWSERSEQQARNSLRQAVFSLRRRLESFDPPLLEIAAETIRLDPARTETDVARFEALAASTAPSDLSEAIELYRGELLQGVVVRDPAFEEWLFYERERLRELAIHVYTKLIAHHVQTASLRQASESVQGLLRLDPLDERAHRDLMRLYAEQGRWGAAIRQYQTCSELLQHEIGVAPKPETSTLYSEILEGRFTGRFELTPDAPEESDPVAGRVEDEPDAANTGTEEPPTVADAHRPSGDTPSAPGTDGPLHTISGVPATPPAISGGTEHRHVTVMYCELSGATQLEPEVLQKTIKTYQDRCAEVLEALGGYAARCAGSGIFAYFGYPTAHEEDAERAAAAGLRIVDAIESLGSSFPWKDLPGLAVRVGISTGSVVTGDLVGEKTAEEAAVIGEAPETAMYLCRSSRPNTVVIGPETQQLAAGRFQYRDLGHWKLDDRNGSVHAWQVVGEHRAVSRFEAMHERSVAALVGRSEELSLLLRRWELAKQREGQVVLISGEAGIGKSRLVHALREHLTGQRHSWVQYQCSAYHQNSAFYPLITQLEQEAGFSADDTVSDRQHKVRMLAEGQRDADVHTALLAELLSVPAPVEDPAAGLEPGQRKDAILTALVDRFHSSSQQTPTLCVFEDIHWIDPSTLELIERLLEETPRVSACLVLTFRADFNPSWGERAQTTWLTIGRMSPSESRQLIQELDTGNVLSSETCDRLIAMSEGVPLFVEELARLAVDSRRSGDPVDSSLSSEIPATLQDPLMARLDRLGPARDAAQVAALIGREFDGGLLGTVMSWDDEQLMRTLGQLEATGLVYPRAGFARLTYVFKHALIQEAAKSTLLRDDRKRLHALIAEALESRFPEVLEAPPEVVARHYTEAAVADRAAALWQQAGERAAGRAAHLEAISHFSEGLAVIANIPDSIERAHIEVRLRIAAAQSMRIVDRVSEALDHLEHAEAVASPHGLTLDHARIHHLRGNLYFPIGNLKGCMSEHALALQYAQQAGSAELEARSLGGLGDAEYARGRMLSAHGYFHRCVAMCRKEGFEDIEVSNLPMVATTRHYRMELQGALEDALNAYEIATRTGNIRAMLLSRACTTYPLFELADFDRVLEFANEVVELADRLGASGWRSSALDHKARALYGQGKRREALEAAREALALSRSTAVQFVGPRVLGLLALLTDDQAEREKALAEGDALLHEGALSHNHLWFHRHGIELALGEGNWGAMEHHARALEDYTSSEPLPLIDFYISRARVLSALGRGTDVERTYDELQQLLKQGRNASLWNAMKALDAALESK